MSCSSGSVSEAANPACEAYFYNVDGRITVPVPTDGWWDIGSGRQTAIEKP
jgi:hypothetical protein